jgi:hypothetical protein
VRNARYKHRTKGDVLSGDGKVSGAIEMNRPFQGVLGLAVFVLRPLEGGMRYVLREQRGVFLFYIVGGDEP